MTSVTRLVSPTAERFPQLFRRDHLVTSRAIVAVNTPTTRETGEPMLLHPTFGASERAFAWLGLVLIRHAVHAVTASTRTRLATTHTGSPSPLSTR